MIETFLTTLPNLGVGVASVAVLYFVFKIFIQALDKRENTFREYVDENNHKTTEILVEAKDSIKESSEFIKIATDVMREVRDHLIQEKK